MTEIWKFPIEDGTTIGDVRTIDVDDAVVMKVLSAGFDPNRVLCLWAEVVPDPDQRLARFPIRVLITFTGPEIPDDRPPFVDRVDMGPTVLHVYADVEHPF